MGLKLAAAIFACISFGWTAPAFAFLGSDESSLDAVKLILVPKGETIIENTSHRIHEYAVRRGTIRAYVSESGMIFGYTGTDQMGHAPSALFGPYLKEYQDAVKVARHKNGRHPLAVSTAHVRAGISGPMGSLHWYLYLQNLPAGVSPSDIH